MTEASLPIKKTVGLTWRGMRLSFDVAQELFSSHQVDSGSRMLLNSLEPDCFGTQGRAADFGCGYGVLGIAWQRAMPGWSMAYVDRDALAVAFTEHNVARHEVRQAACHTDIALPVSADGYDLVLWNVPGKAGRPVVTGLRDATLDALAPGGLLAVVVVHPLADLFTELTGRDDVIIELAERGAEHTVVHLRRRGGEVVPHDPFAEGVFDRAQADFSAAGVEWSLTPVHGLPEYDELRHATQVAAGMMAARDRAQPVEHWLVVDPGVGHLAAVAARLWPEATGLTAGRDMLALRSTARALGDTAAESMPIPGVEAIALETPGDIAVVALPVQASADVLGRGLDALAPCVAPSAEVILHGRSTEVARAEREVRRRPGWRANRPVKQRGFAALPVRTPPA